MSEVRTSFGFELAVGAMSDVGRVRDNNEDSYGIEWLDDGSLMVVVCDGMGGHEAGEVASSLAVQVLKDSLSVGDGDLRPRISDGLIEANRAILEEAEAASTGGMGTTAIMAVLQGPNAFLGQVGDSRCYLVRSGHCLWRTVDHTRVQMLIDEGRLSEDEARSHPESGMLTRALGHEKMANGSPLVPEVYSEPVVLDPGDVLVFCSDGLTDLVDDWEIAQMVAGKEPEEAAELLIDTACERGGHDNVTVAVVIAGRRAPAYDEHLRLPDTIWGRWEGANYDEPEEGYDPYGAQDGWEPEAVTAPETMEVDIGGPIAMAPGAAVAEEAGGKKKTLVFAAVGVGVVALGGLAVVGALVGAYFMGVFG